MLYAPTIAIGPSDAFTVFTAKSAAVTAASMPGEPLPLTTAEVEVTRSIVGLDVPGCGAINSGWKILTSPWLFPHTSAAVMISACSAASSSSHPIMRRAAAVLASASAMGTLIVSEALQRDRFRSGVPRRKARR